MRSGSCVTSVTPALPRSRGGRILDTLRELGAVQTRIRPGRPTSNGAVERVQRTILEECWRPSFARSRVPKLGGLERDLEAYLAVYNTESAHTPLHAGTDPLADARRSEEDEAEMTAPMCRYISVAVHTRDPPERAGRMQSRASTEP